MNHTRNATRFGIVLFWLAVIGLAYSVFMHSGNAHALSWFTWLIYAAVTIVVLYTATVLTAKFWNIK
jgi:hypothetical protein